MNLRDALKNNLIWGTTADDVPIQKIQFHSNKVAPGDLFVAIPGKEVNGHDFMKQAVQAGAVVLVGEAADPNIEQSILYYQVANARLALAQIASCYYREPSNRHTMIGITGTNGKTTTAHLLYEVLKTAEISCSLIGSVCQRINGNEFDSAQTTPDALQLHQWLDMSQDQVVIMEVSSHGIDQERTSGIDFDFAIFTNLTHDHLDYHDSLERYFATKARLFQQIKGQGEAVVFSGNFWGRKLSEQLLTSRTSVKTYGNRSNDFIRISRVVSESPLEFEICEDQHNFYRVKLPLSGLYNAHNALAAWTTARRMGVNAKSIIQAFRTFPGVPGRFEVYAHPAGAECIVDYAHTPDGFNHFLKTLQTRKMGRLIHLFGFRGNSDPSKREIMLNITTGISDIVILTLDDTKGVDATELIEEMKSMIKQRSNRCLYFIADRTKAIEWAWDQARQGDCIAITGKGHENYENQFELPCRSDRETLNYLFQQYSSNA